MCSIRHSHDQKKKTRNERQQSVPWNAKVANYSQARRTVSRLCIAESIQSSGHLNGHLQKSVWRHAIVLHFLPSPSFLGPSSRTALEHCYPTKWVYRDTETGKTAMQERNVKQDPRLQSANPPARHWYVWPVASEPNTTIQSTSPSRKPATCLPAAGCQ